ncbi:MAG: LamG domain-containing protein, partial [Sedimentisphaerales bacterium]
NETFGPYTPVRICYRNGNLMLVGNVRVEGMLIVDGDLSVYGNANTITASKNLPALLVTGDLIVGSSTDLDINGLAVVDGTTQLSAGNSNVSVLGGMFTQGAFVETAEDSSGHRRTGALYGNPTWQPSGGRLNGALSFDGQNDTVQDVTARTYLNGLSAMTLAVWVKSDVTHEDRGIVFTRTPTGEDRELGIRYDRTGASGGGTSGIEASIQTGSGFTQIESSSDVQTTSWQHLALTWENDPNDSHLKLYVNGAPNAPRYDMGPVYGTTAGVQKLMLGCGTKNSYWDGYIDDFRVYSRALSVSEINVVRAGGAVSGLICHWRLDESGGQATVTAAPTKTAIQTWSEAGDASRWGQAAGAFFKSIERR